jgi:hypothetical protein
VFKADEQRVATGDHRHQHQAAPALGDTLVVRVREGELPVAVADARVQAVE